MVDAEYTIGIDEAGRGPWAGPLVAAAVCLKADTRIDDVRDSKTLTPQRRKRALISIQKTAAGIGIGWMSSEMIDKLGLTAATAKVMQTAWQQLPENSRAAQVLIDGNIQYINGVTYARAIPGGDKTELSIAAASIVAKVFRDNFMQAQARIFPDYGFETHVGYGTKRHHEALQVYGSCVLHRCTFAPIKLINSK